MYKCASIPDSAMKSPRNWQPQFLTLDLRNEGYRTDVRLCGVCGVRYEHAHQISTWWHTYLLRYSALEFVRFRDMMTSSLRRHVQWQKRPRRGYGGDWGTKRRSMDLGAGHASVKDMCILCTTFGVKWARNIALESNSMTQSCIIVPFDMSVG